MFEHYNEYYDNLMEYLKKDSAQMNISDMSNGVDVIETFCANVYGHILNHKMYALWSETEKRVILYSMDMDSREMYKSLKLKTLGQAKGIEFSCNDTCEKLGHTVRLLSHRYTLIDNALIDIDASISTQKDITLIYKIHVYLDDLSQKEAIEKLINDSLVYYSISQKSNISVAMQGTYGVKTTRLDTNKFDCNINENYNDDVPYEPICKMLKDDRQHLILLHGEPGTGKTSLIKKLANDNQDMDFIYLDFKLITSFSDGQIFDFLSEHKKSVFIIEDCEKLFTDRNNGNQYINSMLNLTDGIIGEAFKIKFICTFNAPVQRIDKAVLRKGRLSLMYEFKKLSLEKTKKLLPTATEPMTLADIYVQADNGTDGLAQSKIGFGK